MESCKGYFELVGNNQRVPFNRETFDAKKDYAKVVKNDLVRHSVYVIAGTLPLLIELFI